MLLLSMKNILFSITEGNREVVSIDIFNIFKRETLLHPVFSTELGLT
jgi:hypothetical protein